MRRFYTLIELLTVIFIIVLLAGLIMPATSLVRGKARRTSCASNLKQVQMLTMQFSNDRDGQLPLFNAATAYTLRNKDLLNYQANGGKFAPSVKGSTISGNRARMWTAALVRYAKYDMKIFFCPSDERSIDLFDSTTSNSSYSLNYGDAERPGGISGTDNYVNMHNITRSPGNVFSFLETDYGKMGLNSTESNFMKTQYPSRLTRKPHSNEFNVSFLDGHAEMKRSADIAVMEASFKIVNPVEESK